MPWSEYRRGDDEARAALKRMMNQRQPDFPKPRITRMTFVDALCWEDRLIVTDIFGSLYELLPTPEGFEKRLIHEGRSKSIRVFDPLMRKFLAIGSRVLYSDGRRVYELDEELRPIASGFEHIDLERDYRITCSSKEYVVYRDDEEVERGSVNGFITACAIRDSTPLIAYLEGSRAFVLYERVFEVDGPVIFIGEDYVSTLSGGIRDLEGKLIERSKPLRRVRNGAKIYRLGKGSMIVFDDHKVLVGGRIHDVCRCCERLVALGDKVLIIRR